MSAVPWHRLHRRVHYWGAILCALPLLLVILTGILLLLKKQSDWIQPPTMKGQGTEPAVTFASILETARSVPQAEIEHWEDIDRLDVRPDKGIIKIRSQNRWEIQIDHQTGEVKLAAYRRSELIESLHDGSFFHPAAKLWVFLPAALVILTLWLTGIYLFAQPFLRRWRRRA